MPIDVVHSLKVELVTTAQFFTMCVRLIKFERCQEVATPALRPERKVKRQRQNRTPATSQLVSHGPDRSERVHCPKKNAFRGILLPDRLVFSKYTAGCRKMPAHRKQLTDKGNLADSSHNAAKRFPREEDCVRSALRRGEVPKRRQLLP